MMIDTLFGRPMSEWGELLHILETYSDAKGKTLQEMLEIVLMTEFTRGQFGRSLAESIGHELMAARVRGDLYAKMLNKEA